jgi:hypothetical protein
MALPELKLPSGVPNFVAPSQAVEAFGAYAAVPMGSGHGRQRRIKRTAPRRVSVTSHLLTGAQMTALDAWFEDDLRAGALPFSAQLSNVGTGTLWWPAFWVAPWKAQATNGRWRVNGQLFVTGDGQATWP